MTQTSGTDSMVSEVRLAESLVGMANTLGIEAQPGSPLAAFVAAGCEPDDSRPNAAWASIVRTLAGPKRRVDAALTGSEGVLIWAFHGSDDDTWVGLWPERDGLRVTGPMTRAMIGGYVGVFFAGLSTPSTLRPIVTTEAGMAAVAAAIDAWRAARFREWSDHRRPGSGFSTSQLADTHLAGLEGDDGRWLTTMLADVSGIAQDTDAVIGAGVDELRSAGLVRRTADGFELSDELARLADDVWFPQPSLLLTAGESAPARRLVAARGNATVWVFEMGGNGQSSIVGTDDVGLADTISDLVAG